MAHPIDMESNVAELPLSHKLLAWFETSKKQVMIGAAVAAVLGLIIYFFIWRHDQTELAASQALSRVITSQTGTAAPRANLAQEYLKEML